MTERTEYNSKGYLDEVVAHGSCHLERMSKRGWFLAMTRADGTEIAIWFDGKISLVEERPAPVTE